MMPVNLMKVVTAFYKGGTEGQVLQLVRCLDHKRFKLQFACLHKVGDTLDEFERMQIPVTEFNIPSLYDPRILLQQARFAAHLRRQNTQIVHSYNFYSNMFALPAARLARVPVVIASIRDRGVYLSPAQKLLQRWVCRLADRILVNADSIRDWLVEQGLPATKISVIKNGIDMSQYPARTTTSLLREELRIPSGVPVVVLMARLNPQKGVTDFIHAAAMVNRTHPDVHFLIVGASLHYADGVIAEAPQYPQELKALIGALDMQHRIQLTGNRSDTPDILANAAISVLPSHSEGLSNTLLESMAAGVPTIATDVGGNPELVRPGVNGLLVPVCAPAALAAAMNTILDQPALASHFSTEALKLATRDFSLAAMTAATEALYHAELARQRRGQQNKDWRDQPTN